jgi:hypothetical protein
MRHFDSIGARLVVQHQRRLAAPFRLDVGRDRRGEHFDLALSPTAPPFAILNADSADRHLLLYAGRERFLCGHDERHWFVATITERVSTVRDAKTSLLPAALRQRALRLGRESAFRRRNELFKRQGEWFFVPATPNLSGLPIHRHEPLLRSVGSKPHYCEELVRFGGEVVHFVNGVEYSEAEYKRATLARKIRRGRHETRIKNPEVYARGAIRHPDHATLVLYGWHQVFLNGETTSENVAFYD